MAGVGRKTDTWSSRFGFIMAAVGSSVGLGNFWRFPYTAGENGGGAFIAAYLVCVLLIGLPLLMAEYAMGRKSGMSAIEGVQSLARAESRSQNWGIVGWVGSLTSFFILSFYMVISTWLLAFLIQSFGGFSGMDASSSGQNFLDTIGQGEHGLRSKWYILGLLALFLVGNIIVVGRGVKGGIERAATLLMPAFFVMLVVVVGFSLVNGDTTRAFSFIFEPKWEDVGFKTFLAALGQAFFSLSIGVGLMITYGAYLNRDTNIPRSSAIIVASDTTVALIAGFAIFPIVFSAGLDPSSGPSLFFVSMPVAFGSIPGGAVIAPIFFALALFAAFTSSISLMEVAVSWLEERQGVTRFGASLGIGFTLFMIGAAYVFSLEYLDFMDFMTEGLLLPLGGLLTATFAGWVLSREMLTSELGESTLMNAWRFTMRWVVPPFIAIILVFGFMDKIQDQYHVPLPGVMTKLLGPNWIPPVD
jgi:NSS family neurotransmitter:Na+ symporter